MITLNTDDFNSISQESYERLIGRVQYIRLACACGHSGCLSPHGSYTRSIKTNNKTIRIRIRRVICSICGHTHALMPSCIVPYSAVMLCDQAEIIGKYESVESFVHVLEKNNAIDENNAYSILRSYRRHWKERLRSLHISINNTLMELVEACVSVYKRVFMQIKKTPCILYTVPT